MAEDACSHFSFSTLQIGSLIEALRPLSNSLTIVRFSTLQIGSLIEAVDSECVSEAVQVFQYPSNRVVDRSHNVISHIGHLHRVSVPFKSGR